MPDYKAAAKGSLPGEPPKKIGRPKGSKNGAKKEKSELTYTCCCCSKEYKELQGNFVTSSSPLFVGWGGYVPFCRECIAKYYMNIVLPAVDGDEKRAVEHICGICDWYYDDDLFDLAVKIKQGYIEKGTAGTPLPIVYGQRKNMTQWVKRGKTYLDTVRQRWAAGRIVQSHDDLDGNPNDPNSRRDSVDEEDVWFFGPGYSPAEYRYLREQYADWCERYDCQLKAQEEIFKMLAIAQLNVQKAQQAGESKKATEAIKTLQELMNTAKIQPKQKDSAALTEQNTFGTLIRQWENEKPIPEPAPEWRDVDNIKRYIGAYFLGHLCKMFKIDNEWSQIYEEEMAENTAERPRDIQKTDSDGDRLSTRERMSQMRSKNSSHILDES